MKHTVVGPLVHAKKYQENPTGPNQRLAADGRINRPRYWWNVYSWLFYSWVGPFLSKCFRANKQSEKNPHTKESITIDDVYWNFPKARAKVTTEQFTNLWNRYGTTSSYPWVNVLFRFMGIELIFIGLIDIIYIVLDVLNPLITKWFLKLVSTHHLTLQANPHLGTKFLLMFTWSKGTGTPALVAALVLCISLLVRMFAINFSFFLLMSATNRLNVAITGSLYEKSLRLSYAANQKYVGGLGVNIATVDPLRIQNFAKVTNQIWNVPLHFIIVLAMLCWELKTAAIPGLIVLAIYVPIQMISSRFHKLYRKKANEFSDERIQLTQESISGVRVIKYFSLENIFINRITSLRTLELKNIRRILILIAGNCSFLYWLPIFASTASIAFYAYQGNPLEASFIFSIIGLFNALSSPIWRFPDLLLNVVTGLTACRRVAEYLNSPEVVSHSSSSDDLNMSIMVENASFEWETPPPKKLSKRQRKLLKRASFLKDKTVSSNGEDLFTRLEDITFSIPRGSLVIIAGPVGSGKTSLVASLVGDLKKIQGTVMINGLTGYAQQQAWIRNGTVRDNIIFGKPFDKILYKTVISQCSLESDLEGLPDGDMTLIGEKGVALSGGQKQRVGLARLVYNQPDVAILDDILSALDPHVAANIFDNLICKGLLSNATRILVTHNIDLLTHADIIIIMGNGKIVASGTYEQVVAAKGRLSPLVQELLIQNNAAPDDDDDDDKGLSEEELASPTVQPSAPSIPTTTIECLTDCTTKIKLGDSVPISKDEAVSGIFSNNFSLYVGYRGSWVYIVPVIASIVLIEGLRAGKDLFLTRWLQVPASDIIVNISIFCGLGAAQGLAIMVLGLNTSYFGITASKSIHDNLLKRVFRAFTPFFDTTPLGAILNKFSSDLQIVDNQTPDFLFQVLYVIGLVMSTMVMISFSTWPVLVLILPIISLAAMAQIYYRAGWTAIQILIGKANIPVTSQFAETFYGLSTIKSLNAQPMFRTEIQTKIDNVARAIQMSLTIRRWISIRGEALGDVAVLLVCIVCVLQNTSGERTGLLLSYAMMTATLIDWLLKQLAELETSLIAVERIGLYDSLEDEDADVQFAVVTPPNWPTRGLVAFDNVTTKYRHELPPVLKGVSFVVQPGERIAIVGRSGAGKSSIIAAIYRMAKITTGKVSIDGLDIMSLTVDMLRENLAIVPQDPILFSGTLRFNLDPKGERTDDQIWKVLQQASLKEFVTKLADKLDSKVEAGGSNFSVGQRQLLCLARALLRHAKILILDEATANVDVDSDALIQNALQNRQILGSDCTLITIAHRIRTVLNYDKIMVLNRGRLVEYDSPRNLLKNPNSDFCKMVTSKDLIGANMDLKRL